LKTRADSAVAPDQVFIPVRGAEAVASVLTNRQLDPCGKIPEYKFCAACVGAGRGSRSATAEQLSSGRSA
jgi:formate dehydrogenase major subunit